MLSRRGFTLIEVMIVLAIIAGIVVLGAPRIFKSSTNLKSVSRHIIVLAKETRNQARLSNSTMRIVFEMSENRQAYWVERAAGPQAIDIEKLQEPETDTEEENKPASPFSLDNSLLKQPKNLPDQMKFASVESINLDRPVTEGKAYVHFSPQGFVEASAIQIVNSAGQTWTLVINPITGQADIVEKAVSLKEMER